MHEMGIAMQVMEIAQASLPNDLKGVRIVKINLAIGKLAAVVPDSLRFCFEVVTKDTSLSEAELFIEEIPVKARCNDCSHKWTISGPVFTCPECSSGAISILSGRELDIVSIEVADQDGEAAPSIDTPKDSYDDPHK